MFGLGWLEVGLIVLAAILVFGPKKLPAIGKSLGQSIRGFKDEIDQPSVNSDDDC